MRITGRLMSGAAVAAASLAAMGGVAGADSLPRIYSTVRMHGTHFTNVVEVRPRFVVTDSADGGQLNIRWTRWTAKTAAGYGSAHPDHGSYPIRVEAFRVRNGQFTRLTVWGRQPSRSWHRDPLALGYLGGLVSWINLNWMNNPNSGATPWPR